MSSHQEAQVPAKVQHVPGLEMDVCMVQETIEVSNTDSLTGNADCVDCDLFCMRDIRS